MLNQILKSRMEADYEREREFTEAEARATQAEAEDFVAMVEALIPALLALPPEKAPERAEGEPPEADTTDTPQ